MIVAQSGVEGVTSYIKARGSQSILDAIVKFPFVVQVQLAGVSALISLGLNGDLAKVVKPDLRNRGCIAIARSK